MIMKSSNIIIAIVILVSSLGLLFHGLYSSSKYRLLIIFIQGLLSGMLIMHSIVTKQKMQIAVAIILGIAVILMAILT